VAKVGNLMVAERALLLLHEEAVFLEGGEDGVDVEQMF
jgi:hypothetical protein